MSNTDSAGGQCPSTDFLLNPAIMRLDCPVDVDGIVTLQIPVGDYSLASIIAVNEDSAAFLTADLGTISLKTKDIAMRLPLNPEKKYERVLLLKAQKSSS